MPIKKKKISELTLADSMVGLYTIGVKMVNGVQTSVKVSLEFIKKAYDDVVAATKKANDAAKAADDSGITYLCIQVKENSLEHFTATDAVMG